ncbi:tetratricopeptide repeat protein [Candidatus Auribacterota bacterium]
MEISKAIRLITVLMIVGLCGFFIFAGTYAYGFDGEALGGECGVCGNWIAAGDSCSCWQQQSTSSQTYSSSPGGYQAPVYTGPSPEELERQRKRQEATELNKLGIHYWNCRNWKKAAEYFEKALDLNPTSKVIRANLRRAKEIVDGEIAQQKRREEWEEAEKRIKNILSDLNTDFDGISASGPSGITFGSSVPSDVSSKSSLDFVGSKEPLFSKGNKHSAPVGLQFVDSTQPLTITPEEIKGKLPTEKGLKINYVPKPALPSLEDYQYHKKTRADIILDTLEVGRGSHIKSVRHLEDYLKKVDPGNIKVRDALSYITGLGEGDYLKKSQKEKKSRKLFDPSPEDSKELLEAIVETQPIKTKQDLPRPQPPVWKVTRDSVIANTLDEFADDIENLKKEDFLKCINYLKKEVQANPDDHEHRQALLFFEGVNAHFEDNN